MPTPDPAEILDCATAAEWEAWLANHHAESAGIWLRIGKKGAGHTAVTISNAGDVALCYGWIDSRRQGGDPTSYLQRYGPRRPKSPWSQINVARAEALIAAGRMQPAGWAEIAAAQADGRWAAAYESQRTAQMPADLAAALAQNARARQTFDRLTKSSQYAVILPLLKATTADSRAARLQTAIMKLEAQEH
jgi:uncharacterized protein YdeI (YjbR/CyaY-like superfamily)